MTTEDLLQFEAIRQLKARYCRLLDTRRWDDLFELFTEDAVFGSADAAQRDEDDVSSAYAVGHAVGRSEIAAAFREMSASVVALIHKVQSPELELTSPDTAKGIWQLEHRFWYRSGPLKSFHGYGYYYDTYERVDGVWRFKSKRVNRLRSDAVPAYEQPSV